VRPVVFVNGQDPTTGRGGGSTYVRVHARAARRAGFEPHVFSLGKRDEVVDTEVGVVHRVACPLRPRGPFAVAPGAPAERLAHWAATYAFSPHAVALHARRLANAVGAFLGRARGPHLVHGFSAWGTVGVALRVRRAGVRAVASVYAPIVHEARAMARGAKGRGSWPARLHLAFVERTALRHERRAWTRSDLVLVNYESVRRLYERAHGRGAPVRRVPYTSDGGLGAVRDGAEAPEPAALAGLGPDGAPLVVTVSRHDPRKGYPVLIDALARLRAGGTRFRACLVGGGPLLSEHRREVARRGLADAVTVAGSVESPRPFLRRADAFVLPSIQEASGSLSLLEALEAGAPVVASGIDGIVEDVTDGEDALLVPPDDPARLAGALGRLLGDAGLRARLAARGRETFRARFSSDALAEALRSAYASVGVEG
jgi:glycosyltransferase involved in cell wall biosynthesis